MLNLYLPVLYYHGNLYVTEGAYAGGRGFPLSQRSFLFIMFISNHTKLYDTGIENDAGSAGLVPSQKH